MKCFPSKILLLKFSFFFYAKFATFARFLKKSCLLFLFLSGPLINNGTKCPVHFDNAIRITLKIHSIRIILSIGSLNCRFRISEGLSRFSSINSVYNSSN